MMLYVMVKRKFLLPGIEFRSSSWKPISYWDGTAHSSAEASLGNRQWIIWRFWRWRRYVLPKRLLTFTGLRDIEEDGTVDGHRSIKIFEYKTGYYELWTHQVIAVFADIGVEIPQQSRYSSEGACCSAASRRGGYWPLWRPHLNWNLYYSKNTIISHVYVCRIAWRYVVCISCFSCIYFFYVLIFRLVDWGWDWVRLIYGALIGLIVTTPGDTWVRSSSCNENWQRKPKYSEKTAHSAILSTAYSAWPDLGSNPGRHGWKTAINCPNLFTY
jgi:hypothetical protein